MSDRIVDQVRRRYSSVATKGLSSHHDGVRAVAEAFGYTADELSSIPAEANMGLSCGNPVATARLRPGEVVVDLGCGGGLDVLLAAPKVGAAGKVIGIDMSHEMIELARRNATKAGGDAPRGQVEFHVATIDQLPLADLSVDCVISNCVINLAPDKRAVLREIARVLKPGGRLAVSDIALKRELPAELRESLPAYIGCIAGAIRMEQYRELLLACGFDAVEVMDTGVDLNAYAQAENDGCCDGSGANAEPPIASSESCCGGQVASSSDIHAELTDLFRRYDVNQFAASVRVFALKPV